MTVYDPTDGTSLTELIRLVRMELQDFPQAMHDVDKEGDGVATKFRLYQNVYEADGVSITAAGTAVAAADFTVDYDSGWVTFDTAPATGSALVFDYSCVCHSDEQVTAAINAAIDDCYGPLVAMGENSTLTSTGATELLCETSTGADLSPDDQVERVEYWDDPTWVLLHDWRINNHSGKKYIHFRRTPASGLTIRISYITRPGSLSSTGHTLEGTAGLPTRARAAIVLLSSAKLVSSQLSARTHSNMFYNAEGNNMSKVYDLRMRIQDLQAEGELALRKVMPRRGARGF